MHHSISHERNRSLLQLLENKGEVKVRGKMKYQNNKGKKIKECMKNEY
jgi:hypothetical protein